MDDEMNVTDNGEELDKSATESGAKDEQERTFTQEEVNQIIQKRLDRERNKQNTDGEKEKLLQKERDLNERALRLKFKEQASADGIPALEDAEKLLNFSDEESYKQSYETLKAFTAKAGRAAIEKEPILNPVSPLHSTKHLDAIGEAFKKGRTL